MSGNGESDKLLYCIDSHQWWSMPSSARVEKDERGRCLVAPEIAARIMASIALEPELRPGVGDSPFRFLLVTANEKNKLPTTGVEITQDMIIKGLR